MNVKKVFNVLLAGFLLIPAIAMVLFVVSLILYAATILVIESTTQTIIAWLVGVWFVASFSYLSWLIEKKSQVKDELEGER